MKLVTNLSVVSMESFLTTTSPSWDVFTSCGSFEERSDRSTKILSERGVKLGTSIIFNYKETDPENRKEENIGKMRSNLESISDNTHIFDTDSVSQPKKGMEKFLAFLKNGNINLSGRNMLVDLSVFTKPYFFLLFKILSERFSLHQFDVVYTEPGKYRERELETGKIILTEGLDRVESIPGFAGSSVGSKDALIVILGFEGKRALEIFYTINPELTYAINGFPSYQPGWHKVSWEANLRFLRESGAYENIFYAPARHPFETMKVVSQITRQIRKKDQDSNIVVAPLGTKMQAFGVLLFALLNRNVKVVYPFPSVFKPDYSTNYGPSWIFRVDLNKLNSSYLMEADE